MSLQLFIQDEMMILQSVKPIMSSFDKFHENYFLLPPTTKKSSCELHVVAKYYKNNIFMAVFSFHMLTTFNTTTTSN